MAIRAAAIGMNHWHSLYDASYLRHLAAMPDVRIVGIHDDDPRIAAHRASEVGGSIPTFASYPEMLSETKPDFVLALGRHDQMAEVAHHLLDRRVPFVMEKPMSFNARQLRGVVEKADALDGFAAVPYGQRFSPLIQHAKRLAEEGRWGRLCHFYARMNRPTSARYPAWDSPWMLDPKLSNGGCLRNLGSHGLDCFVYLTGEGEDIEVTGAQLSWRTHGQLVEDYASVLVRSASGVLGTIEVGNSSPANATDGELKAAFQRAILISEGSAVRLHTAEGSEILPPLENSPASPLRQAIEAAIRGDKPPVSVYDCYLAVRLIDLAYLAAGNPYGTAAV